MRRIRWNRVITSDSYHTQIVGKLVCEILRDLSEFRGFKAALQTEISFLEYIRNGMYGWKITVDRLSGSSWHVRNLMEQSGLQLSDC